MPAHSMSAAAVATRQNVVSVGFAEVETAVAAKARPQFSSVRQVALDMYRKEGPRAFFRGLSASYWGISESAIQFALYEECKNHIEEPTNFKYFLTAGACKLLASLCTYPHEVVRTRMRDQRAPLGSKELKYVSVHGPVDHQDLQGGGKARTVRRSARAFDACRPERCNFVHGGGGDRQPGLSRSSQASPL
ncbi:hypothetical protein ON010_g6162 [Phytophthora cinnamomi]|nr:hypothetical protein ON010_g6162 [Phytophthora cinnamomi]